MPETGRQSEAILTDLDGFAEADPDYRQGRLWSLVYYLDEDHQQLLAGAYQRFASANGLNPSVFKSLKRLETAIISATADILNGTEDVCGVVTSGGTESCLMAVKTYRDWARAKRRVKKPEMILPRTAHVAWFKAAEYFNVRVRLLPMTEDGHTDIRGLEKRINRHTVMLLGSAPDYPHGTIDPIEAMGAIAEKHGLPLHVDACVGGFILPFMAMNGVDLPLWDYRVPGVTSISADIHKYGYAAKGASTITYRNLDWLRYQMFVHEDWPGGVFASPALLGTRPGGAYAAAWAALQYFGKDGYRRLAHETLAAVEAIKAGIAAQPELAVIGRPQGPLLGYRSLDPAVNIFAVGDRMEARGWQINRLQQPDGLHCMVTAQHRAVVDTYLADLAAAVAEVKANPELAETGGAATYGLISHLPLRGLVRRRVLDMFANLYRAGGGELSLEPAELDETDEPGEGPRRRPGLGQRLLHWYLRRRG